MALTPVTPTQRSAALSSDRDSFILRSDPWRDVPPRPHKQTPPPPNPWQQSGGRGPNGSGGPPNGLPPELAAMLARLRSWLRVTLGTGDTGGKPPGAGGPATLERMSPRAIGLLLAGLLLLWLASGFYRVQPDEQGAVLRFGAYVRTTLPGLNYHLPWPIEQVQLPAVTRINRIDIGYRSGSGDGASLSGRDTARADIAEESLMLTGDENIIDINAAIFWRIRDARDYLFNTRNPQITVKSAAESVLREVIGRTPIQPALTDARGRIEAAVTAGVQDVLDQYGAGVEITQVQLQRVDPPPAVIESFRDVQRANTDADRMRNEAESYHNDIVPRARGDAARIVAEADATRQADIAEASGAAQRFDSVLKAYQAAKDVTLQRLYIETMQDILAKTPTTVVKSDTIIPYLPLLAPAATLAPPVAPTGTASQPLPLPPSVPSGASK